jgi:hypothetical protein
MLFYGVDGNASVRAEDGLKPGAALDDRPGKLRADAKRSPQQSSYQSST